MFHSLGILSALAVVLAIQPGTAGAAVFQYEILGASEDWIVVRENIPASEADTAACTYPRLDPSEYVGVNVHFVRLPAEAKRGRLLSFEPPAEPMPLYVPARGGAGCTSVADADRRWKEIASRAKGLGISLSAGVPEPVVLGAAVPAKSCILAGTGVAERPPCRRVFKHPLKAGPIQIAVSLTAVPEAPDKRSCQFVGYRFGAAIQVAGLDFGTMESGVAPGGFSHHYDCRSQQFNPLRLYLFGGVGVLMGGFSGANIADRDEYPFLTVFPTRRAQ